MPNFCILASRVVRFNPKIFAAPFSPITRNRFYKALMMHCLYFLNCNFFLSHICLLFQFLLDILELFLYFNDNYNLGDEIIILDTLDFISISRNKDFLSQNG